MRESCLKINYDYAKKVDDILKKHGIEYSYTDYLKNLENQYKDSSGLLSDYVDRFINWGECKKWKEKYKALKRCRNGNNIIRLKGIFIIDIWVPEDPSIDSYNKDIEWVTKNPETLEEIDQYLSIIPEKLDAHLTLRNNKDLQSLKEQIEKEEKDFKLNTDAHNTKLEKLRKRMEKLIEAQSDFK